MILPALCNRMMIMTQCLRSDVITLRKPCALHAAPSAIMTYANTRCLPRHYSRAVALATSGNVERILIFLFPQHCSKLILTPALNQILCNLELSFPEVSNDSDIITVQQW